MGWKTIKDHYGIKHTVQVDYVDGKGDCICIGSGFIPKLITISLDGCVLSRYESLPSSLEGVYTRMLVDYKTGLLQSLVVKHDTFVSWWPVYYPDHGLIHEDFCEQYGYPNITHSGALMFDNKHFKTVKEARVALLEDTRLSASSMRSRFGLVLDHLKAIGSIFRLCVKDLWWWAKARTLGRFIVRKVSVHGNRK